MGSLADAIDSGAFTRAAKAAFAALQVTRSNRASQSAAMGRADRGSLNESLLPCNSVDKSASSGGGVSAAVAAVALRSGSSAPRPQPLVAAGVAATAGTPAMRAVYLTLLEVSLALRHLHALSLVHCDVS
jgi:hypothetical protein